MQTDVQYFDGLNIEFNATVANLKSYANKLGVIDKKKMVKDTQWVIDQLHVKTPSQKQKIGNLSGGNQQKVIMGRWLLIDSQVMMLDEPTRGIDVGAKYEIYQLAIDYAAKGKGIIFISSEMPEILGMSDRIIVMCDGRITGEMDIHEATQEKIMHYATQFENKLAQ